MKEKEPTWYRDAVFYEVYVRGFFDSTGDGNGDLRGLIEKLDYLKDLGIDCIWLMPIYESPLKDDGYDISDFRKIHPSIGTVEDFEALTAAAHAHGIRVITDLVANHTSDQHPWFQEARRSPESPKRGYYVWSDSDEGYRGFVGERYPGTLLLAEANQWPADLLPYFGNGDEFHMAFHFRS